MARQGPDPEDRRHDDRERDDRTGEASAEVRVRHQELWVDLQVRRAVDRGEFDTLPGLGRPIEGLTSEHDPDWWLKNLIEREQITGVLPPSLQIRREDAELDARLDRMGSESEVRRAVADFNERVRWALYRPAEGPPMITAQRDPDHEVVRWRERLEERRAARQEAARALAAAEETGSSHRRNPLFRWGRRRPRGGGRPPLD